MKKNYLKLFSLRTPIIPKKKKRRSKWLPIVVDDRESSIDCLDSFQLVLFKLSNSVCIFEEAFLCEMLCFRNQSILILTRKHSAIVQA